MTTYQDTRIVWQVQARKSRAHKWTNKGRFETRSNAREAAIDQREFQFLHGLGFGNTRVVRIELPIKAKKGKA